MMIDCTPEELAQFLGLTQRRLGTLRPPAAVDLAADMTPLPGGGPTVERIPEADVSAVAQILADLRAATARVATLENRLAAAQAQASEARRELQKVAASQEGPVVDELRAEVANRVVLQQGAAQRIRELEAALAQRQQDYASLDHMHRSLINDLDHANHRAQQFEASAVELSAGVSRLTDRVAELEAQVQQEQAQAQAEEPPAPAAPPARFSAGPVPELGIRLLTPEEQAAKTLERETERQQALDGRAYRGERTMPARIGDPGADVGDGLDIWRCDGSRLLDQIKRDARAAGLPLAEVRRLRAYSDADYARLIARLEEVQDDGRITDHVSALAAIVGRNRTSIYTPLMRAHALGISTEPVRVGRFGNAQPEAQRLTEKGRALLQPSPVAARDGQPSPAPADATDQRPLDATPDDVEEAPFAPAPLEPTAEQRAQIAALNAENDRHVAATRRAHRSHGVALPVQLRTAKNRDLPSQYRRAAEIARKGGWAIGVASSGAIEWHGPRGQRVVTSSHPVGGVATSELRSLQEAGISW